MTAAMSAAAETIPLDLVRMMVVQQLEENCLKTRMSPEGLPLPHTQPMPKTRGDDEQTYRRTDAMTVDELLFNIERVRALARLHTMHADAMQAHVDMLVAQALLRGEADSAVHKAKGGER